MPHACIRCMRKGTVSVAAAALHVRCHAMLLRTAHGLQVQGNFTMEPGSTITRAPNIMDTYAPTGYCRPDPAAVGLGLTYGATHAGCDAVMLAGGARNVTLRCANGVYGTIIQPDETGCDGLGASGSRGGLKLYAAVYNGATRLDGLIDMSATPATVAGLGIGYGGASGGSIWIQLSGPLESATGTMTVRGGDGSDAQGGGFPGQGGSAGRIAITCNMAPVQHILSTMVADVSGGKNWPSAGFGRGSPGTFYTTCAPYRSRMLFINNNCFPADTSQLSGAVIIRSSDAVMMGALGDIVVNSCANVRLFHDDAGLASTVEALRWRSYGSIDNAPTIFVTHAANADRGVWGVKGGVFVNMTISLGAYNHLLVGFNPVGSLLASAFSEAPNATLRNDAPGSIDGYLGECSCASVCAAAVHLSAIAMPFVLCVMCARGCRCAV